MLLAHEKQAAVAQQVVNDRIGDRCGRSAAGSPAGNSSLMYRRVASEVSKLAALAGN